MLEKAARNAWGLLRKPDRPITIIPAEGHAFRVPRAPFLATKSKASAAFRLPSSCARQARRAPQPWPALQALSPAFDSLLGERRPVLTAPSIARPTPPALRPPAAQSPPESGLESGAAQRPPHSQRALKPPPAREPPTRKRRSRSLPWECPGFRMSAHRANCTLCKTLNQPAPR